MSETLSKSLFTPDSSLVRQHRSGIRSGDLVLNPSPLLVPPTSQQHVRVSSSIAHRSRQCPSLSRTPEDRDDYWFDAISKKSWFLLKMLEGWRCARWHVGCAVTRQRRRHHVGHD